MRQNKFILSLEFATSIKSHLEYKSDGKFDKDKVLIDNEEILLVFDGVALNKNDLLLKNSDSGTWENYLLTQYKNGETTFFSKIKGSYFGVVFCKKENKLIAFTDHIGSKHLYYHQSENRLVLSSNSFDLISELKGKNLELQLDVSTAYLLLSFGFPLEDRTIVSGVKRLMPGHVVSLENNELRNIQYFKLSNSNLLEDQEDDEIIENIDKLFRNAVKRAFDKDLEYGYKHLVALSGGLDSRMTSWVAHDMGYKDQVNFTFSQSNYLDETIPKKIASDLKHDWIFNFLDNGNFLKTVDKVTHISGGNVLYYGLAHGNNLFEKLDVKQFGLVHTGQLGDVIIGTYNDTPKQDQPYRFGDGAYSKKMLEKLKGFKLSKEYENQELYKLFNRGFIGTNYGLLIFQNKTETYSPFYDIDLLSYCLRIPIHKRLNHKIYKLWVKTKYTKAGEYIWEKTGSKVNKTFAIPIKGKEYSVKQVVKFILKKTVYRFLKNKNYGIASKNHMNPIAYWFNTNKDLRIFYSSYYEDTIHLLEPYPKLKRDVDELNQNGTAIEKIQILSLLSIAKFLNE